MKKSNNGISMITLVITIIVIIILASVALNGSTRMMGDANKAREDANADMDNDTIRTILTYAITDNDAKVGFELTESIVVKDSGDREYGKGFYLIPGGTKYDLATIEQRTGQSNIKAYKDITAAYVVDYDNGTFVRLDEVIFK